MILVTGGARVGKTKLAINLCKEEGSHVLYIAASEPSSDFFEKDFFEKEIIRRTRKQRPYNWDIREDFLNIADILEEEGSRYDAILLENLTSMVGCMMRRYGYSETENNLRLVARQVVENVNHIVMAAKKVDALIVYVTNEVVILPPGAEPFFKAQMEILGRVNQYIASVCQEGYLVVSGIPVKIK
jgi:adenosylcobinamide kinase/adenosylcobinamide-phosphate guanylyltransferase